MIRLGLEQLEAKPDLMEGYKHEKKSITVMQLLKEREFSDGRIEKNYSVSEISIVDSNGQLISLQELKDAYTSGSSYNDYTLHNTTIRCTIYATMKVDKNLWITYRCDKVTSTVYASDTSILPTVGTTEYWHNYAGEHKKTGFTARQTQGMQVFTLSPDNPQFAISTEVPMGSGLYAQSVVYLTNGNYVSVQAGIQQDNPW